MSVINSTSENSLELEEFEDYEKNDLVIDVIDDLNHSSKVLLVNVRKMIHKAALKK